MSSIFDYPICVRCTRYVPDSIDFDQCAQVEFNAQTQIQQIKTSDRLRFNYTPYNIDFSCPIFPNIGPIVRIQDPKHAKKTGRNAAMSGARALTFGHSTIGFNHFTKLLSHLQSPMYKSDVYKLDRQDDGAAYRTFCPKNLACCLDSNNKIKSEFKGTFIYLFIIGELVDSYLNRNISPLERIRMAMTSYFFLRIWRFHINTLARKYPEFISVSQNFIASQTFAIMTSLAESIVLLVKAHRDYYSQYPLIPWIYGSEACEHFFGAARQINADFDFAELLEMVPKIGHYTKALNSKVLSFNKEKSVRDGYQFEYNNEIIEFDQSRQLACDLAEFLGMLTPDIVPINSLRPYILIGPNDGEVSGSDNHDECMQDSDENFSNLDLSQIIGYAAKEVNLIRQKENEREKVNINKDSQNLSLNECQKQLSFIDIDETLDSSIINTDINNTDTTILVTENVIDFQEMVYQREKHNAYNSRNIERTIKTNSTKLCKSGLIKPNQANHIVSFFSKNENAEMRIVKQREKRWKNERKTMSQSLATFYEKGQSKKRQKILIDNKNLIENIESANINSHNPLNEQDFVLVVFGLQLCIGQVISSFYEVYGYYSYHQEPITDI
ncbi:hypothetical protein GLOIN_2v1885938 [Rhizophagus irregularis DAOM 181602=DAOM 197198]|uniref:Uncharacterized protein n=1 Tax=Rhizophagus irregularis (strain DAOM 181602 / DAOM 197198 / MUCL 43194) TaxID=747089 RepID=A0A2P4NYU4_RHIID|nr:hypothetical protein GLOIN_2v1885938 [Rhizophagus irregularis DAOM 181602=DAOM 197198]POG58303.1 hypothetical protein GLOIN_2v1885938 [Rhizophagus irregularis DAOM 181602=DAOM 197198]|eukprot:XP_025165169.1 hypothetical protein GLOIN_2v1885938 [Rhizophagus irregularis DAOM 181602=DAOM 197198]